MGLSRITGGKRADRAIGGAACLPVCDPDRKPQPQRNHPEHINKIERVELLECLNERDAAGNVIMIDPLAEIRAEYKEFQEQYKAVYKRPGLDFDFLVTQGGGTVESIRRIIAVNRPSQKAIEIAAQDKIEERYVSFYAEMGVQAARRKSYIGGGWRLYAIAKSLDENGTGRIKRDDLEKFMSSLGVPVTTYKRWLKQARNYSLLSDIQSQTGEWFFILPNAGAAADAMGLERIGRKVAIYARDLIGNGWKARVWGAYEAIHNGRPIAREKMQKIINVPVSTQRYRDNAAGVERTRNYCKSEIKADMLTSLKDYSNHKGVYVGGDGFIYWRLPNSYQVSFAMRGGRGRARKANKIIKIIQSENGLSKKRRALSCKTESFDNETFNFVRLFNASPAQQKATIKKLAGINTRGIFEIYEHSTRAATGAEIWTHTPILKPIHDPKQV